MCKKYIKEFFPHKTEGGFLTTECFKDIQNSFQINETTFGIKYPFGIIILTRLIDNKWGIYLQFNETEPVPLLLSMEDKFAQYYVQYRQQLVSLCIEFSCLHYRIFERFLHYTE